MPGITEQQLHKHSGLRTRQVIIQNINGNQYFDNPDPDGTQVGDRWEQMAGWDANAGTGGALHNPTLYLTAGSGGSTRSCTVTFYGEDAFGRAISESVTVSGGASANATSAAQKSYGKVTGAEVTAVSGMEASDTRLDISNEHGRRYGLPIKIRSSADILGGWCFEGGAEVDLNLGSHVTYSPTYNDVTLNSAVAPDAGNDRMVVLCLRTNDR